jgi:ABC-type glycerol-3-phosphate transport system permease component
MMKKEPAVQLKKTHNRDTHGDRIFNVILNFFLAMIGLMALYPLIFVVSASVSDPIMVNSGQVLLFPKGFNLDGYKAVFENQWVLIGYRNTLIYTVVGTVLNVLVTFMAAYPLTRRDMFGHRFITLFMVFTMWFGGGLIPTFLVVNKIDYLSMSDFNQDLLQERVRMLNREVQIFAASCRTGEGINDWCQWLSDEIMNYRNPK